MEEPPIEIQSPVNQAELYNGFWWLGFKWGMRFGTVVGIVSAFLAMALAAYCAQREIEHKRLHPKIEAVYVP